MRYTILILCITAMLVFSACESTLAGEAARFERESTNKEMGLPEPIKNLQPSNSPPVIEGFELAFMGCTQPQSIVQIREEDKPFRLGDSLNDFNGGLYGAEELPWILKDGVFTNHNTGEDHPYSQHILLGNAKMSYGRSTQYGPEPLFHIDLQEATQKSIDYYLDFSSPIDVTNIDHGERFTMFGIKHVFAPYQDDIVLHQGGVYFSTEQGENVIINTDGEDYTITLLGGNMNTSTAFIRVAGSEGSDTRSLQVGESRMIAGLNVYLADLFISEIPEPNILATLHAGADTITIPANAISPQERYRHVEINGEETNVYAWAEGVATSVNSLRFRVDPTDFDNEDIQGRWRWITEGKRFHEPLFGLGLLYQEHQPRTENMERSRFLRIGDAYELEFVNTIGNAISFEAYRKSNDMISLGANLVLRGGNTHQSRLAEGSVFILQNHMFDEYTEVYELGRIEVEDQEVMIKELSTGQTTRYRLGYMIGGTGVTIVDIDASGIVLSDEVSNYVVLTGDHKIILGDENNNFVVTVEESDRYMEDTLAESMSFRIINLVDKIAFTTPEGFSYESADASGNTQYGVSVFGSSFEADLASSGAYLNVFTSQDELEFLAYLLHSDVVMPHSPQQCRIRYGYHLRDDKGISDHTIATDVGAHTTHLLDSSKQIFQTGYFFITEPGRYYVSVRAVDTDGESASETSYMDIDSLD